MELGGAFFAGSRALNLKTAQGGLAESPVGLSLFFQGLALLRRERLKQDDFYIGGFGTGFAAPYAHYPAAHRHRPRIAHHAP